MMGVKNMPCIAVCCLLEHARLRSGLCVPRSAVARQTDMRRRVRLLRRLLWMLVVGL